MYFLSEDGLAQLWPQREDWPFPPIIFPGGGGRTMTEDERIDDEIKRGTGVNAINGARNALEFDYFPDSGFGATISPTILSSNNQFVTEFAFPLELAPAAHTWSMLSNALREAGRDREALDAARAALAQDPWLGEAHLNEGAALHVLGDISAALASYFVASRLGATRDPALANLRLALRMEPPSGNDSPVKALVLRLLDEPADHASLCSLAERLNQADRRAARQDDGRRP